MIIKVDDIYAQMIIDGMDLLIRQYDEKGYRMEQIPLMVNLALQFRDKAKELIAKGDDPDEKFAKEHPEFTRPPKPGEKFVIGQGYVDDKKK